MSRREGQVATKADASQNAYARFAGVMYFFTVFDFTGVIILSRISGSGGFLDVAHKVAASETLYRIGLLFGLVGSLSTILLAIGLYVTLKSCDGNLAMAAMLFRVVEAVLGEVVVILGFASLDIYLAAIRNPAFDANQLAALADLVSRTSASGIDVSVVFFSVGSATFFFLFLRSAYIPRVLASWGLVGSLLCLGAFTGSLLFPQSSDLLRGIGALPIGIAEPVVGLWLLVRGIKNDGQMPDAARVV
ncbi:MAG: DUF4386 domain-containing protein [Chloroflexi bacterium]|nr:MAG: DUF4386 domain-containing protein [Chloroflexota bacterium]